MSKSHVLLVDAGSYFIKRVFHAAIRGGDTLEDAVETVFLSITRAITDFDIQYALCAFDSDTGEPWQRHIYAGYESKYDSLPAEFKECVPVIKEGLHQMGIRSITIPCYEADDLLASSARSLASADINVQVLSSDPDLAQLDDERIEILDFDGVIRDRHWVYRRFGISPTQLADYIALVGGRNWNRGVTGIGPKRARLLLSEYQNLESLVVAAHMGQLPSAIGNALITEGDDAIKRKTLSKVRTDLLLGLSLSQLNIEANLHEPIDLT